MLRFSPRILALLAALAVGHVRARAAELLLPPVAGELGGVLTKFALPGAPELRWKISAKNAGEGMMDYLMSMNTEGSRLSVSARLGSNGSGTWRIEESRVEVGRWLAVLAPPFAPALAGMVAEGALTITGGGNLRQGKPDGKIRVEWANGVLRDTAQGWALEGVALSGEFSFDAEGPQWASTGPLELTVRTISTARFGARNFLVRALLNERREVALTEMRVEVAGGEIVVEPCLIPLVPPSVDLKLKISRVGLQDIVALVPAALADARGRIDGEVRLSWSETAGLEFGRGWLKLNDSEAAQVTLAPQPGLITGQLKWWNPARLWKPAFHVLSRIELGQTPLAVNALLAEIIPEGDVEHRTARVRINAASRGEGMRVPLEIDVGVSGLLNQLLKLGLDDRVKLGGN